MHETILCAGRDIAADDIAFKDEERCEDAIGRIRVVCDAVAVLRALFAGIGQKVETLRLLHRIIRRIDIVKFCGNDDLAHILRLRFCLPAEGR